MNEEAEGKRGFVLRQGRSSSQAGPRQAGPREGGE